MSATVLPLVLALGLALLCAAALKVEGWIQGSAAEWQSPGVGRGVFLAGLAGAAAAGGCAVLLASPPLTGWPLVVLAGAGCWLAAAMWMDGRAAWAPDTLVFGAAFWICAFGIWRGDAPPMLIWAALPDPGGCGGHLPGAGAACGLRVAITAGLGAAVTGAILLAFWWAQVAVRHIVMTPPDAFALVAPVLALGVSVWSLAVYALLCVALIVSLRVPAFRRLLDWGGAAGAAAEELGFRPERWGQPVPLLSVAMPCLWLGLVGATVWPLYGW
jgi:hypothetical protein